MLVILACAAGPGFALDTAFDASTARHKFERLFESAANFDCANVSCKRLRSCEEACFKLIQCGQRVRDGDNDGIPCENLCSRRCK